MPIKDFTKVVFPAPDGPMRLYIVPALKFIDKLSKTALLSNLTVKFLTEIGMVIKTPPFETLIYF